MSAESFGLNGQPIQPPQPAPQQPSEEGLVPAVRPALPAPDAVGMPAPQEEQPSPITDPRDERDAEPAADTPQNGDDNRPADSNTAASSVDSQPDPFFFDPDDYVHFGDEDPEAGRAAWKASRQAVLDGFRRDAEAKKALGGPPYLGWFSDEAIPASKGRYRFGIDREQLLAALTHLAAVANPPKGSQPIVRIALGPDQCKFSVSGPRYEFAAIALTLADSATGFECNADPIAFTLPILKLFDIVQTRETGAPVRMEFNGDRDRLLVHGRQDYRRVPTFAPKAADQALFGTPKAAGILDPVPLAQGLRLLKHVIRKPEHSQEPPSW